MNKWALSTLLTLGQICCTAAEAQEVWRVDSKKAKCFLENLGRYAAIGEIPTLIYLDACPSNDPAVAISNSQNNSALPTPRPAGKKLATVLVFTPDELKCLATIEIPLVQEVVEIPRKPKCDE